jgi:ubiquinone/menaquinone biosynthesis C-methylase UbiE
VPPGRLRRVWWGLIRFGFRLLYNEFAWTYDIVSRVVSLGQWRAWQRTALLHLGPPGGRVLELAHGTGDLQLDLRSAGYDSVGLDLSPYMGRIARRKLLRRGVASPQLVRASAYHLPFAAGAFDAVVSTFPTPFILQPEVLREAHRVLCRGGQLVIVFNGLLTARTPAARSLEWLYEVTGQRGPFPGDPAAAFREAGFDARVITETLPRSVVLLTVAGKSPAE